MAELDRRDDDLTTADLARRSEQSREPEQRMPPQTVVASQGLPGADPRTPSASSALSGGPEPTLGMGDPRQYDSPAVPAGAQPAPLFSESEVGDFRSRWNTIQTAFVDEPRRAVEDADNLVASLMTKLAEEFANERAGLEKQWDRGDNVSTEDLRLALQRYRSFFDRLLKV